MRPLTIILSCVATVGRFFSLRTENAPLPLHTVHWNPLCQGGQEYMNLTVLSTSLFYFFFWNCNDTRRRVTLEANFKILKISCDHSNLNKYHYYIILIKNIFFTSAIVSSGCRHVENHLFFCFCFVFCSFIMFESLNNKTIVHIPDRKHP